MSPFCLRGAQQITMRIALGIEYDGSTYHGWQTQQPGVDCVQNHVERAVGIVANHPAAVICAGRTDAGVHATAQVVHFDTAAARELKAWVLGVNAHMPRSIVVRWAKPVADDFHARYSAFARSYRYVILNTASRPALLSKQVTWHYRPLDALRMQAGASHLIGEHDFTSFRAMSCQSKSPMRYISDVRVMRHGDMVMLEVRGNAFLHHMVRNMAGALMDVGNGKREPDWIGTVLQARDRRLGAATAAPYGLYLVQVEYPDHFGIPREAPGPFFVPAH